MDIVEGEDDNWTEEDAAVVISLVEHKVCAEGIP